MRIFIYIVLSLTFIIGCGHIEDGNTKKKNKNGYDLSYGQDYIFVIHKTGNVEFKTDNNITEVKERTPYFEKTGKFILKDNDSELYVRIHKDQKDFYTSLTFLENKSQYTLIDLITQKQDIYKEGEEGWLDKCLSMLFPLNEDEKKYNGMLIGKKSSSERNLNDTNTISINEIEIIDNYPIKIDFSNLYDSLSGKKGKGFLNKNNNKFNVLVRDYFSKDTIINKEINATYFNINHIAHNSLFLKWNIEINNISSSKIIKGVIIESKRLRKKEERRLLDKLRDKAIDESKTEECTYQIIFLETLRSSGLIANAAYYLDLFIETNNHQKLVNYKNHYVN